MFCFSFQQTSVWNKAGPRPSRGHGGEKAGLPKSKPALQYQRINARTYSKTVTRAHYGEIPAGEGSGWCYSQLDYQSGEWNQQALWLVHRKEGFFFSVAFCNNIWLATVSGWKGKGNKRIWNGEQCGRNPQERQKTPLSCQKITAVNAPVWLWDHLICLPTCLSAQSNKLKILV